MFGSVPRGKHISIHLQIVSILYQIQLLTIKCPSDRQEQILNENPKKLSDLWL